MLRRFELHTSSLPSNKGISPRLFSFSSEFQTMLRSHSSPSGGRGSSFQKRSAGSPSIPATTSNDNNNNNREVSNKKEKARETKKQNSGNNKKVSSSSTGTKPDWNALFNVVVDGAQVQNNNNNNMKTRSNANSNNNQERKQQPPATNIKKSSSNNDNFSRPKKSGPARSQNYVNLFENAAEEIVVEEKQKQKQQQQSRGNENKTVEENVEPKKKESIKIEEPSSASNNNHSNNNNNIAEDFVSYRTEEKFSSRSISKPKFAKMLSNLIISVGPTVSQSKFLKSCKEYENESKLPTWSDKESGKQNENEFEQPDIEQNPSDFPQENSTSKEGDHRQQQHESPHHSVAKLRTATDIVEAFHSLVNDSARERQLIAVTGETGVGKSCIIPLLMAGLYDDKNKNNNNNNETHHQPQSSGTSPSPPQRPQRKIVWVTQPTRAACISLAKWMSTLVDEPVGALVGYATGESSHFDVDTTQVLISTPGYAARYLASSRTSLGAHTVIVDEAHHVDEHLETLLAVASLHVKDAAFVFMSATMDFALLRRLFNVSSRTRAVSLHIHGKEHFNRVVLNPYQMNMFFQEHHEGKRPSSTSSSASNYSNNNNNNNQRKIISQERIRSQFGAKAASDLLLQIPGKFMRDEFLPVLEKHLDTFKDFTRGPAFLSSRTATALGNLAVELVKSSVASTTTNQEHKNATTSSNSNPASSSSSAPSTATSNQASQNASEVNQAVLNPNYEPEVTSVLVFLPGFRELQLVANSLFRSFKAHSSFDAEGKGDVLFISRFHIEVPGIRQPPSNNHNDQDNDDDDSATTTSELVEVILAHSSVVGANSTTQIGFDMAGEYGENAWFDKKKNKNDTSPSSVSDPFAHLAKQKLKRMRFEEDPKDNPLTNRRVPPFKGRTIVLATNIAESSVTIPHLKYVIDLGLERYEQCDAAQAGCSYLATRWISETSARQRAGRVGRLSNGVVLRLYHPRDVLRKSHFLRFAPSIEEKEESERMSSESNDKDMSSIKNKTNNSTDDLDANNDNNDPNEENDDVSTSVVKASRSRTIREIRKEQDVERTAREDLILTERLLLAALSCPSLPKNYSLAQIASTWISFGSNANNKTSSVMTSSSSSPVSRAQAFALENAAYRLAQRGLVRRDPTFAAGIRLTRAGLINSQLPLPLQYSRFLWSSLLFGSLLDAVVVCAILPHSHELFTTLRNPNTNNSIQKSAATYAEPSFASPAKDAFRHSFYARREAGVEQHLSEPWMLRQIIVHWLALPRRAMRRRQDLGEGGFSMVLLRPQGAFCEFNGLIARVMKDVDSAIVRITGAMEQALTSYEGGKTEWADELSQLRALSVLVRTGCVFYDKQQEATEALFGPVIPRMTRPDFVVPFELRTSAGTKTISDVINSNASSSASSSSSSGYKTTYQIQHEKSQRCELRTMLGLIPTTEEEIAQAKNKNEFDYYNSNDEWIVNDDQRRRRLLLSYSAAFGEKVVVAVPSDGKYKGQFADSPFLLPGGNSSELLHQTNNNNNDGGKSSPSTSTDAPLTLEKDIVVVRMPKQEKFLANCLVQNLENEDFEMMQKLSRDNDSSFSDSFGTNPNASTDRTRDVARTLERKITQKGYRLLPEKIKSSFLNKLIVDTKSVLVKYPKEETEEREAQTFRKFDDANNNVVADDEKKLISVEFNVDVRDSVAFVEVAAISPKSTGVEVYLQRKQQSEECNPEGKSPDKKNQLMISSSSSSKPSAIGFSSLEAVRALMFLTVGAPQIQIPISDFYQESKSKSKSDQQVIENDEKQEGKMEMHQNTNVANAVIQRQARTSLPNEEDYLVIPLFPPRAFPLSLMKAIQENIIPSQNQDEEKPIIIVDGENTKKSFNNVSTSRWIALRKDAISELRLIEELNMISKVAQLMTPLNGANWKQKLFSENKKEGSDLDVVEDVDDVDDAFAIKRRSSGVISLVNDDVNDDNNDAISRRNEKITSSKSDSKKDDLTNSSSSESSSSSKHDRDDDEQLEKLFEKYKHNFVNFYAEAPQSHILHAPALFVVGTYKEDNIDNIDKNNSTSTFLQNIIKNQPQKYRMDKSLSTMGPGLKLVADDTEQQHQQQQNEDENVNSNQDSEEANMSTQLRQQDEGVDASFEEIRPESARVADAEATEELLETDSGIRIPKHLRPHCPLCRKQLNYYSQVPLHRYSSEHLRRVCTLFVEKFISDNKNKQQEISQLDHHHLHHSSSPTTMQDISRVYSAENVSSLLILNKNNYLLDKSETTNNNEREILRSFSMGANWTSFSHFKGLKLINPEQANDDEVNAIMNRNNKNRNNKLRNNGEIDDDETEENNFILSGQTQVSPTGINKNSNASEVYNTNVSSRLNGWQGQSVLIGFASVVTVPPPIALLTRNADITNVWLVMGGNKQKNYSSTATKKNNKNSNNNLRLIDDLLASVTMGGACSGMKMRVLVEIDYYCDNNNNDFDDLDFVRSCRLIGIQTGPLPPIGFSRPVEIIQNQNSVSSDLGATVSFFEVLKMSQSSFRDVSNGTQARKLRKLMYDFMFRNTTDESMNNDNRNDKMKKGRNIVTDRIWISFSTIYDLLIQQPDSNQGESKTNNALAVSFNEDESRKKEILAGFVSAPNSSSNEVELEKLQFYEVLEAQLLNTILFSLTADVVDGRIRIAGIVRRFASQQQYQQTQQQQQQTATNDLDAEDEELEVSTPPTQNNHIKIKTNLAAAIKDLSEFCEFKGYVSLHEMLILACGAVPVDTQVGLLEPAWTVKNANNNNKNSNRGNNNKWTESKPVGSLIMSKFLLPNRILKKEDIVKTL